MKCPICNSFLPDSITKCPSCGATIQPQISNTYTGKTKSRTLAGILMLFGIGDLYILDYKRFLQKLILVLPTLCIGTFILQMVDTYKIFSGKIDCDLNGIPLV